MKQDFFKITVPAINGNIELRAPQIEGYERIEEYFKATDAEREVTIVLPVGCGKSGLMTIAPFAIQAKRVLIIAPGTRIASQLNNKDFNQSHDEFFYGKCQILKDNSSPEVAEIRSENTNIGDLEDADVVITNIQQLQGTSNKWLASLSHDFFDLILFDEGHHNVAQSWKQLRDHFPEARIINLSATPTRADGQVMEGRVIYSYPVARAIAEGYVKRLKGVVLSPATLRFVRNIDGIEQVVSREEVIKLGEDDSDFRRSIVSSKETLATIIDCSIRQLNLLRKISGSNKHKIIVAALNYAHCIQIKEAYRARKLRADYVHSKEEKNTDEVLRKLEADELDVIIQVRKLGEGFDHKWLSIAVICSIFSNLSPFVQFVGRIMRVAIQNNPNSPHNQGIVIYHAGSNIAQRWTDFKNFSEADQAYFDDLLITEEVFIPGNGGEQIIEPAVPVSYVPTESFEILNQTGLEISEDNLVELNPEQKKSLELLVESIGREELIRHLQATPIKPRRQDARRAAEKALDEEVKNEAGKILAEKKLNPKGKELDTKHLGRENFVTIKSIIDRKIAQFIGRGLDSRPDWSMEEITKARNELSRFAKETINEI